MQTLSQAAVTARSSRMTTQRATGLVFAGVLQVVLIFAIIEGLNIKVWPVPETKTIIDFVRGKTPPPEPLPQPTHWVEPTTVTVEQPPIIYDDGGQRPDFTPPTGPQTSTFNDYGPASVAGTHTTPPYPPVEARLGESGTVWLRLTISPQGLVADAAVLRSSGYDGLDQAARLWVMSHWRYRPAMHAGAPAAGLADVQVQFDLRNAR